MKSSQLDYALAILDIVLAMTKAAPQILDRRAALMRMIEEHRDPSIGEWDALSAIANDLEQRLRE